MHAFSLSLSLSLSCTPYLSLPLFLYVRKPAECLFWAKRFDHIIIFYPSLYNSKKESKSLKDYFSIKLKFDIKTKLAQGKIFSLS